MTALPNPTAIPGVVRAGNWWHSKLPPLLSVVYAAALLLDLPALAVTELWWAALVSVLGIASYGHVVNDAFDIEVDRKAGKHNAMAGFTVWQRWFVALLLLGVSFAPATLLPFGQLATALVAVNCLLPTLYSVPPVRIKERGLWAVLFDAGGAHVVPTLWIALVALRLAGVEPRLGWAFVAVMTLWALTVGIKGILRHQIFDLEADEQAGVTTFSNRLNLAGVASFLERRWHLAELAMFACVVVLLTPAAPILPLAVLAYLPLEFKKQSLGWRFKFDVRDPVSQRHQPLVNNYFYELALPVVLLVHLAWRQPWLGWLLPAHLALFWKNVYVQWADLRRLVQHARDVRVGRESLHRFRGSFEQTEFARGTLRVLASNPQHFQLRVTAADGQMDHLRFCHGPWTVVQGQAYAVRFRARSHALRRATIGVRQQHEPWAGLGLDARIVMDARWRTFEISFTAAASDSEAVFFVTLGDAVGPVEIEGVQLARVAARDWALMSERPFVAQCVVDAAEPRTVRRVEVIDATEGLDGVRLHRLGVSTTRGHTYRLLATVRADRPREIALGVCRFEGDWGGLGAAETLVIDAAWKTYYVDFVASETEENASIYFWLGGAAGDVDFAEATVWEVPAADSRQLIRRAGVQAQLQAADDGRAMRLELLAPGELADHVRLSWPVPPLKQGEYYCATLELRADRPRKVGYGVSQLQEPFAGLGLSGELSVSTQWQTFSQNFRSLADEAEPGLYLLAGGDAAAIEIRAAHGAPMTQRHPYELQFAPGLDDVAHDARLPKDDSSPASVALHQPTSQAADIALRVERFSVTCDCDYELTFQARATNPRTVGVGLLEADEPWGNLGLSATVQLTSHWRTYVLSLRATASRRFARVCYWLGGSQHEFEVRATELHPIARPRVPWEIRHTPECAAQCVEQGAYRVELLQCGVSPADAQVVFRWGPTRQGRRYRAKMTLQADARRSVLLSLGQRQSPWRGLAADVPVELEIAPRTVFADFLCEADEPDAALYLHVGGDPTAVSFSGVEFRELEGENPWRVDAIGGGQAEVFPQSLDDGCVRVDVAALGQRLDDVKLVRAPVAVEQGRWYAVRFRARSEVPRRVMCCVQQDQAPWGALGFYREFNVTDDWQIFVGGFLAVASDPRAVASWILGDSRHALELADVSVAADDRLLPLILSVKDGSRAMLVAGTCADSLRCVPLATGGAASDIWLKRPLLNILIGRRYRLQFQARSDVPRECAVGVAQSFKPWASLGLYRKLELTKDWQAFDFDCVAEGDDPAANLSFWVGQSLAPLELKEIRLTDVDSPDEPVAADTAGDRHES